MSLRGLDAYFGAASPLAAELDGFAPRPEQLEMAGLVVRAMEEERHLAVEAGAGTGKTLAYLVPALLSGRKVIVATATRTLQDQLYHRDLPAVGRALGRPVDVAQLKGRSNYLCRHRHQRAIEFPEPLGRQLLADLRVVTEWANRTVAGDISEVTGVDEDSRIWPLVTSTADNCLGSRCPQAGECHLLAARRRAAESGLAVVNHHLLVADMTLKDDGFARLLPGADIVIVDEAHRFPETAQSLFDVSVGSRQVEDLLRDVAAELREAAVIAPGFQTRLDAVAAALGAATAALGAPGDPVAMGQAPRPFSDALGVLAEEVDGLRRFLVDCAPASPGLERARERADALAAAASRVADWEALSDLCWAQAAPRGFSVHMTPLDASGQLRDMIEAQGCTWILTSATLAVGDDFSHFTERLGLDRIDTHRIASPFDYGSCARLFLPKGMPTPDAPDYTDRMIGALEPVLAQSRGRAFLLFTSRRALERAAALLAGRAHGHTLLVQGTAPRSRLLDQFARVDNAVLLGTATFWEGVDIRGPALVVVAIDRLPFASPGDPLLQARLELVRRAGGDPFREYQLPRAVLTLRQGVGRLIRGHADYGIVMICDPRLTARGYGKVFLESLPPMPVIRSAAEACAFLEAKERVG